MSTLILASEKDIHAQSVAAQLGKLGIAPVFLHLGDLLQAGKLTYDSVSGRLIIDKQDGRQIDFSSLRSVWNRRPGRIESPVMPEQWIETLIERECNTAINGIFRTLECLWVNHPAAQNEASIKVHQLKIASRSGLQVPESIITNDPEQAERFYEKHRQKVIYKLIDELSSGQFPATEVPRGMPTMKVRPADLSHFDQVRHSLHFFQRQVEKVADIRVTVVGEEIFAGRIESQQGTGKVDFRLDYSVPVLNWELPPDLAQDCLKLMRLLGLNYGALDFCLDEAGQHIFLEINPAGQFLWLEEALGQPISAALAQLLSGGRKPLV